MILYISIMQLNGQQIKEAIEQLIWEYKFEPVQVLDIMKMGIKTAFKKDYMPHERKSVVAVQIGNDWTIKIFRVRECVEEIEDKEEDRQIILVEAQKLKEDVEIWEKFMIDITPDPLEFTRIGVMAAAQTIKQNLKNIERERFFEKFQDKQGELLKAKVLRVIAESVVLDVDGATVVLPWPGQVPNRIYHTGEEIIVFLKQISKWSGGINLDITQWGPEFIDALLKRIVPEYEEGLVEIQKIVRITWKRTKMIVSTEEENVDPVGVFVWYRWDRINTILSLLNGEKIDIIERTSDDEKWDIQLVKDALKPAKVQSVTFEDDGTAMVKLPEDQKALAIGKSAINIKLASQLISARIELI